MSENNNESNNNKKLLKDNTAAIKNLPDRYDFEVQVENNNIERAIKTLKRKLIREGFYKDIKQRRFFEKPCEKRKRKLKESIKRVRKDQSKTNTVF